MSAYLLLIHMLNFLAAPAAAAILLVLLSHFLFKPHRPQVEGLPAQAATLFIASTVALLIVLLATGRDGSMLGYAAMLCTAALGQWWISGSWRD